MKQDKEWFVDKIKKSNEFAVVVRISDETFTYVGIEKATAIQLVTQGAEYGFFANETLIIGAINEESEKADANLGEREPKVTETEPVHSVKRIPIPYGQLEAVMQDLLDRGYKLLTSHQHGDDMITFWDIVK